MNTVWIVGGVAIAVITAFITSQRRPAGHDLGAVSHQWLAEHRQSQESQH